MFYRMALLIAYCLQSMCILFKIDVILRFSLKFGTGSYSFLQQHIRETDPRAILRDLLPDTVLPPDLDDMTLWQIIINISEPPKRKKRKDINTLDDVVKLLKESKRILVLTGAGVCSAVWITLCSCNYMRSISQ